MWVHRSDRSYFSGTLNSADRSSVLRAHRQPLRAALQRGLGVRHASDRLLRGVASLEAHPPTAAAA